MINALSLLSPPLSLPHFTISSSPSLSHTFTLSHLQCSLIM
jgi:hypothetical protein